jgi:hypothetical protein
MSHNAIGLQCLLTGIALLFSARWRRVVNFTSLPLYNRGKNHGAIWTGDWMDHRESLNYVEKRGILPLQGIEYRSSSP